MDAGLNFKLATFYEDLEAKKDYYFQNSQCWKNI